MSTIEKRKYTVRWIYEVDVVSDSIEGAKLIAIKKLAIRSLEITNKIGRANDMSLFFRMMVNVASVSQGSCALETFYSNGKTIKI